MSQAAASSSARRGAAGGPTAVGRAQQRLMLAVLLFGAATAMISARLVQFGLEGGGARASDAVAVADLPPRADIVDRSGAALAQTFDAYAIAVRPRQIVGDPRELATAIAEILPSGDRAAIYGALTHKGKFRYLDRRVLPADARRVLALGEPAIVLEREPERLYPNLELGAHVLGFTDIDGVGAAGVERALEERITGRRGEALALSIDSRVQQAVEGELLRAMTKFKAIGAAGIVLDANTGEVIAMASLPAFNPNAPANSPLDTRFNRATQGVYELGSTFKAFTVAMGFEAGTLKSYDQSYMCGYGLRAGRFTIRDTHPFGRVATLSEIFKESSNIGTAQIAREIGSARQRAFLDKLGFLDPVQVELKERGRVLSPGSNWGDIATMTVGYGHGIAVSPLHLATGYAALVNGGIWRPATLLKVSDGHPVAPGRRVFSPETSERMRKLLRLVVVDGTGGKADAPGYRVGGKTGSAEKAVGGRYARKALVTTFAGVFPMDDPKYVVVAMLDEPQALKETYGFRTAGWNVAPVVSAIVGRIGPPLGIAPDEGRDVDLTGLLPPEKVKR